MGKIRVKTIGDESLEEADKQKAEVKREQKKLREDKSVTHLPGMEGGQRIAIVGPTEEELAKLDEAKETLQPEASSQKPAAKQKKSKFAKKQKSRSSNYTAKAMEIDKNKSYSLTEGIELLRKVKMAKFDETVELHINTVDAGISGTMTLPHGNGKEVRIAIATDEVLADVEKGKINFDILIATPSQMPKLAKVARALGPRGLMPNPKNGTISDKPEEAMKKFQGGQMSFKTESKNPLIHLSIGKTSFEDAQLAENIKTVIQAVKRDRIRKVTLKSTMSPGIRLAV